MQPWEMEANIIGLQSQVDKLKEIVNGMIAHKVRAVTESKYPRVYATHEYLLQEFEDWLEERIYGLRVALPDNTPMRPTQSHLEEARFIKQKLREMKRMYGLELCPKD